MFNVHKIYNFFTAKGRCGNHLGATLHNTWLYYNSNNDIAIGRVISVEKLSEESNWGFGALVS